MAQRIRDSERAPGIEGTLLDEGVVITVTELTEVCQLSRAQVELMVGEGMLHPRGSQPEHWSFTGLEIKRARRAQRLQQDLELNLAGAALALDLLDEIEQLRSRVRRLEQHLGRLSDAET
ncbi:MULTISPECIES: chaperone modulator CbpM [Thiorhodovibrio]|uniref:chaperone modulator CbpM n=1 Tax=Thiorhodovibrio TaxID=61593 RepID=UPI0019119C81|nr:MULTISPECIES: chaperone modulator CbpM [Thiorhodovibrio]MBK5970499.1 MerR family transcriptional regulator [Thiorhodovibrio winogradskyi]WPL12502.1 Chaperone modulatory protein CbpM [Thiorhodovibrio litoralis]